ncbi:hemicentin-2-like [Penaeus japonicus]|uniref:hemicentin-2-like n=1 Tax=Penaeus japonicus TaxID=27405 RepID=UPI001C715422|nr:hemicentin-2-like [Penaeus japonicus]
MRAKHWWQAVVLSVWCWQVWCFGNDADILNGLEDSPLTEVRAVENQSVLLPCDMDPPAPNDTTLLVLFYRDGVGTPIYSLDSRSVALERGRHWAANDLGFRAYMMVGRKRTGLFLETVHLEDQGEYRCRVDFLESPTRNLRIQLDVVVPPTAMTITSDLDPGKEVTKSVGPYPEGAEVTLSCQVLGGIPPPILTWWQKGSLLDDVSEVNTSHVTRNTLTLPPLTRADLHKVLTCQASNSDLLIPLSTAVTIEIDFPPTSVKLLEGSGGQVTLSEGRSRPLVCEAKGSRPPAQITWLKNGEALPQHLAKVEEEVEGDVSRSILNLVSSASDDGATLTCRGASPRLPESPLEDSVALSVLYKPQMSLELGNDEELQKMEEGDNVVFKCVVRANPPVNAVQWAHDGVPLRNNASLGIAVSRTSLILRNISRNSSGVYTCAAANTEGATTSAPLQLGVKFPPTCAEGQNTVYGAARHEELQVPCHVHAHPAPSIFRWAVNTSTGVVDVALNLSSSSGRSSVVRYTPQTHHDFGELLCWAINDVGQQRAPCVFHVVPAAKPEAVSSCVAERNSSMPATYVVLSCLPGWDGGLEQTFTLEVRQAAKEELLEEFSHAPEPFFIITGLKVDVHYLMTVTAANSRGTSPPVTISYTAPSASAHKVVSSHAHNTLLSLTPFVVLLIGVVAAVSTCVGVGVMVAKRNRRRKSGAEILYAGPLKDVHDSRDVHTIVCVNHGNVAGLCLSCFSFSLSLFRSVGLAVSIDLCFCLSFSVCLSLSLSLSGHGSFFVNPGSLLNNQYGRQPLETDVLLRDKLTPMGGCLAPLASTDSLGQCSTPSSVCTASSKTASSRSSRTSSSTVALNPDYLTKEDAREPLTSSPAAPPKESAV